MPKIGAVLNDASGTLSPQEAKDRLEEIKQRLEPRVSPECLSIVPGAEVKQEIERLKDQGIDTLIIGGGDGTVSTAATVLKGSKISLLVLGIGTRNHFARDLGIPLDPLEALQLIDRMKIKEVDLGEVNGHSFINNASLGLYPNIVREREKKTDRQGWEKWLAQLAAVLIVLRRLPRMRLTVEDENHKVSRLMPFLFVGNNEYKGIINSDSSRPSIDSGKLWLCIAHISGVRSLLRMAGQLSIRDIQGTENLETRRVDAVTVYSRTKTITIAIDGENRSLSTPLHFNILKKSLQVLVP